MRFSHLFTLRLIYYLQKADIDKQLINAKSLNETAVRQKTQVEARLEELNTEKFKAEETLQKSANEAQAEIMSLRASQEAAKTENQVRCIIRRKLFLDFNEMDWIFGFMPHKNNIYM